MMMFIKARIIGLSDIPEHAFRTIFMLVFVLTRNIAVKQIVGSQC